jgi:hypothetical protein
MPGNTAALALGTERGGVDEGTLDDHARHDLRSVSALIPSPLPALSPLHKAEEHRIGLHLRGPERTSEGQTGQRPHAGEGHIHLSGGKRPRTQIEAHIIEGQTLGLVDGDRPCRDERYLPIGSDLPVLDALALLVPLLPDLGPLRTRDEVVVAASASVRLGGGGERRVARTVSAGSRAVAAALLRPL